MSHAIQSGLQGGPFKRTIVKHVQESTDRWFRRIHLDLGYHAEGGCSILNAEEGGLEIEGAIVGVGAIDSECAISSVCFVQEILRAIGVLGCTNAKWAIPANLRTCIVTARIG